MGGKRSWVQIVTLILCAVLLAVTLRQGEKISELQVQVVTLDRRVVETDQNTRVAIQDLSLQMAEGEKLVRGWELTPADMDRETSSLRIEFSLSLKEWRADTEVWLIACQGSETRNVSLENNGDGRFSGALPISPEGEALCLEVRIDSGGTSRREELGGWDDVAMLLPVRMSGSGYSGPTYQNDVFSLGEYFVNLTDQNDQPAAVEEPAFFLKRNGETVWEGPGVPQAEAWAASGISEEEIREMGPPDGGYSTSGPVEIACRPGDTAAMFFTCRDEYGLRYTFPMESWKIDPDKMGDPHDGMAVTAPGFRPALSWD